MDLVGLLASHPVVAHLAAQMVRAPRGTNLVARGSAGSSTALLAGALSRLTDRAVLLVVAHTDDAEEAADELAGFGVEPVRFPALQVLPGESGVALDLLGERLALVERAGTLGAAAPAGGRVIVAPIQALMQLTPPPGALARVLLTLEAARRPEGIGPGPAGLGRWLDEAGYRRVETVEEPGDFAVRGGIVDVFPPGDPAAAGPERPDGLPVSFGGAPVRLDYFGDEIEKIHEIDPETMGVDRRLGAVRLVCARPEAVDRLATTGIIDLLPDSTPVVLHELMEITEQGRGYFERVVAGKGVVGPPAVFQALRRLGACVEVTAIGAYGAGPGGPLVELPVSNPPAFDADVGKAIAELGSLALGRGAERARVRVLCLNEGERSRLGELIEQFAPEAAPKIDTFVAYLHQGFAWRGADGDSEILVPYHELLHRATARRRAGGARLRGGRALDTFVELEVGDYVVHADHGIALFTGLKMMRPLEARRSADEVLRAHTGPARTSPRRGAPLPAAGGAKAASPAPSRADDDALEEYLTLQFDGGSVLHVPAVRIDQVQKYVGGFKGKPPLSVLGGARW
ncbi:MAG: hypothetical protein KIT68_12915, partial [Phycisphaeraceae bacterium]|nr:hypothetical protein [Phycisphaeraceae bacterium]